jgi:hypothetical protein
MAISPDKYVKDIVINMAKSFSQLQQKCSSKCGKTLLVNDALDIGFSQDNVLAHFVLSVWEF